MNIETFTNETSPETECFEDSRQIELFQLKKKPVMVQESEATMSSNAGFLVLGKLERSLKMVSQVSGCFEDAERNRKVRNPERVEHSLYDLLKQRVFQMALGYEDGIDADDLRWDRILQISVGKDQALGSQPMMSRLENWVSSKDLYRGFRKLVGIYAKHFYRKDQVVVLHIDSTEDAVHGQLGLFNGYFGEHCFHPLRITEEKSAFPFAVILRNGNVGSAHQAKSYLKRIIAWLREEIPGVKILIKADCSFGIADLIEWFDEQGVDYMLGLSGNAVLYRETKELEQEVLHTYEETKKPLQQFMSLIYKAQSWKTSHAVIAKVEHTGLGMNQRFIVSSMQTEDPASLFETFYRRACGIEAVIEQLKRGLRFDKTACHTKKANQMRYLESIVAFLFHLKIAEKIQPKLKEKPTVQTIIQKVLKIAALVKQSVRRFLIDLPRSDPNLSLLWLALQKT